MSRKTFWIVFGVLIAMILALALVMFSDAEEQKWTVCYEMPNQHIEWTGAGYNGANARGK